MKIKVVKERDNPFFKRKDLTLNIVHTGGPTPKTDDLKKELAEQYKVDPTQVVVEYIMTQSGLNESTAKVKILSEKPAVVEEPKAVEEPAAAEEPKVAEEAAAMEEKAEEKEEKPEEKGEKGEAQASEAK